MTLDYSQLLDLLPVRHPMVLVDKVIMVRPGVAIETAKAVTGGEPCYEGLGEGLPGARYAYPRSLVIESFGQSAALLWLGSMRQSGSGPGAVPMVGRLRKCRFAGSAFPGDVIRHHVRIERVLAGNAFMTGESMVGGRTIFTVGLLAAVERSADTVFANHR
jgi:3-hydroxyacyl-[acyl-carrier-protein] dehydratase